MASVHYPEGRLKWGGLDADEPIWPFEPELSSIRAIATKHLGKATGTIIDETSLDAQFFAEGLYNKLYLLSYPNHPQEYLFRVSLPIDPFSKIESEVATLRFVRENTTIPVADVIAWESSTENELGYEWILMEKIRGVELEVVWGSMSWEQKLAFTESLAKYVVQLHGHKFSSIGSLYFGQLERFLSTKPSNEDLLNSLDRDERTKKNDLESATTSDTRSVFEMDISNDDSFTSEESDESGLQKMGVSKKQEQALEGQPDIASNGALEDTCTRPTQKAFEDLPENKAPGEPGGDTTSKPSIRAVSRSTRCDSPSIFEAGILESAQHQQQLTFKASSNDYPESCTHRSENSQNLKHLIMQSEHQARTKLNNKDACHIKTRDCSESYVVGPMVNLDFSKGRRLHLPSNRGPYHTSSEWLTALIEIHTKWISSGMSLGITDSAACENVDWNLMFNERGPEIKVVGCQLLEILPAIFPVTESTSTNVLDHNDLHGGNILVDPVTFEITGILDWENTCIIPFWKVSRYPKHLVADHDAGLPDSAGELYVVEEIDPSSLADDVDEEDMQAIEANWEKKLLRERYMTVMNSFPAHSMELENIANIGDKRELYESVQHMTDRAWKVARGYTRRYYGKLDKTAEMENFMELDIIGTGLERSKMKEEEEQQCLNEITGSTNKLISANRHTIHEAVDDHMGFELTAAPTTLIAMCNTSELMHRRGTAKVDGESVGCAASIKARTEVKPMPTEGRGRRQTL